MAKYVKTSWNTTTVFNPTNMNHIEQGIYDADLREGGTIGGDLIVNRTNGTTSSVGESTITLGNNTAQGTTGNSKGIIRLFNNTAYRAIITTVDDMASDKLIRFPDKSGIIGVEEKITNISIANSVGGAESHKATLYATGNVGHLDFIYTCQNASSETLTFDMPNGWHIQRGGIVLRDNNNGDLSVVWCSPDKNIATFKHSGTMTVGHDMWGSAMCYKS